MSKVNRVSDQGDPKRRSARAGTGYEPLIYYGTRVLQDRIVFASGWGTCMIPLSQLIRETDALPLSDTGASQWMHDNAAHLRGLS